jgi:tripartite-type tricarboxylate transporter receptor subunit TctC
MRETCMFMLVNPSAPYTSVGEFIAHAKASPEKLTAAYYNTSSRIGAAIFASRAGIQFNEIPYKDVGQAAIDLIAGRLSVTFLDTVAAAQHVVSRSLKPLAVTCGKRLDIYLDVPALSETFPGTEVLAFLSVSVPKEVPREIQQKLNVLINGTSKDPAILPRLEHLGLILRQLDLATVDTFVAEERKRWTEYVVIAKIEKD